MAGVYQQVDPLQAWASAQVRPAEILELLRRTAGDLGEAVAGQVDEPQPLVEQEEVDLPRPSGGGGGAGEAVAADQTVDQRGLSYVRPPGEGDLWHVVRRQAVHRNRAHEENAVAREENTRAFEVFVAEHLSRWGELRHVAFAEENRAMKLSIGFSTLNRRIMTYC
jgi:hypothetical protein